MRALRLARIAAEAEGLRLRLHARRIASQILFALLALAFLLAALVFGHIALWFWLRLYWEPQYVGLAFFGADIVLAALLALIASHSSPGRVELEALAVRRRALEGTSSSAAWSSLAVQVAQAIGSWRSRSRS